MGRKRRDASLAAPLDARKRRRPEQASGGWASLATDIVGLVTGRLLDDSDIAGYILFRAVCSAWRACTPPPAEHDPRNRPRGWIALCDGDAVRPEEAGEMALFHTRTGMRLLVGLPKLRGYRVVCFSDGLLVLVHKRSAAVRVLNPLTHAAVDFPSLASVYHEFIRDMCSFRTMNAAVCMTSSSIAVVVWFPHTQLVAAAEAGSDRWVYRKLYFRNALLFQERLYAILPGFFEIIQLYPTPPLGHDVVARVPYINGLYEMLLVEVGGRMLLVLSHHFARARPLQLQQSREGSKMKWFNQLSFKLYQVDLNNNSSRRKLTPVRCLGEQALFLSKTGCISVSVRDVPSLSGNSIYFSTNLHPVLMHSLTTGMSEELAAECQVHDREGRIRPSVRPFTIVDHLLTFCHPQEWTKGLMFHEYHFVPESFKELWKKIRAKEWQLRTPP
ncbi:hypothetical protein QYE76_071691 [Lolium multiflorum]|uniref:KIB1-4 beta-propeller domain-containing protein n=1 Tax=Lolium multiflorum TaxID=4521 RepID=A0AAD8SKJ4_LOLMU|nr:hypothetical protein QYE76_071691 [Lolium multiflorum]